MTDPVQDVLTAMAGSYLNRWRLTDDQAVAWREGLKPFSASILGVALNQARVDFPEWPPTLMEFRRYCIAERDKDKTTSDEDGLIQSYNKWAHDHGMKQKMPGEDVETFRRRLVWDYECRRRKCSSAELSDVVAENRAANRRNEFRP